MALKEKQTSGPMRAEFTAILQAAGDAGDTLPENQIRVVASSYGNPDCCGRVIFPGAFKPVLKQFVAGGVMLVGHDWEEMPIGMIMQAKEDGAQLVVDGQFHSTQEAQDARTICVERMKAGKAVPVSLGWYPDYEEGVAWFESGTAMLEFAKAGNFDMSLFDTKAIKALDWCMAIWAIKQIVEFSLVPCGANPQAGAVQVQSLTFDDQFTGALGALDSFLARWEDVAEKREQLGETHREKLLALVARLETIAAKVPDPALGAEDPDVTQIDDRWAELNFRLMSHKNQLKAS